MELEIDLNKSLNENASLYFDKSKKSKKKLDGLKKAVKDTEKKLNKMQEKEEKSSGLKNSIGFTLQIIFWLLQEEMQKAMKN